MPRFSQRSLAHMEGIHPDLQRVLHRAIRDFDFMVIEGVRSEEQCRVNYGKGRTQAQLKQVGIAGHYAKPFLPKVTWLRNPYGSKHCRQADGYGHAVDCVPYPVDWNDLSRFDAMAKAMLGAAKELGVDLRWGADWDRDGKPREKGETDSPHFEI